MPEFILQAEGAVKGTEFTDLDSLVQGYIEAMFFTEECPGVDTEEFMTEEHQNDMREGMADGCLPCDVGFADIHPDSLAAIENECRTFATEAAPLLAQAFERDYDAEQAGRDFWFTRNGHGVGFWDRDQLRADDLGRKLSDVAKAQGEANVWFADHVENGNAPFVYHE